MQPSNETKQKASSPHSSDRLDKHWHMSRDDHEIALSEIEFSIFRIYASFSRWMDDLSACCQESGEQMCSGIDFAVLNIIRMHDRPKSISELGRLMNRDDISNIQYSIRKLTKAGLIEKTGSLANKKNATYIATELGITSTNNYARYRRELLLPLTQSISESDERMSQVANVLSLLSGMYDQAACVAATHRDR